MSRRRFIAGVVLAATPLGATASAQEYKAQQAGKSRPDRLARTRGADPDDEQASPRELFPEVADRSQTYHFSSCLRGASRIPTESHRTSPTVDRPHRAETANSIGGARTFETKRPPRMAGSCHTVAATDFAPNLLGTQRASLPTEFGSGPSSGGARPARQMK